MSDAMIEETGRVVAIEGDSAWVEIERRSACSQCSVSSGCGTSVLSQWFGRRSSRIRVPNQFALKQGDTVKVGVSDQALLKAAFLAYLVPLLAMIVASMLAAGAGASDGVTALFAVAGLVVGLLTLRSISQRTEQSRFQIRQMHHLPSLNINR